jgi:hypothetical protein
VPGWRWATLTTGGSTLDAVLSVESCARVVICGAISQYSNGDINSKRVQGPANYIQLATKNASMTGFTFDRLLISALLKRTAVSVVQLFTEDYYIYPSTWSSVESFEALEMLLRVVSMAGCSLTLTKDGIQVNLNDVALCLGRIN